MDIKHVLSLNPLRPAYAGSPSAAATPDRLGWVDYDGGLVEIGHEGGGFSFDNELPRHQEYLAPYRLADRLVTNGEWLGSSPTAATGATSSGSPTAGHGSTPRVAHPFYWTEIDGRWFEHPQRHWPVPRLGGPVRTSTRPRRTRWAGKRLPSRAGGARREPDPHRRARRTKQPHHQTRSPARRLPDRSGACECTATAGVDLLGLPPTPASIRPRSAIRNCNGSSCPTRWCSGAAARSPGRAPYHLLQLLRGGGRCRAGWPKGGSPQADHVSVLLKPGQRALSRAGRPPSPGSTMTLPPR
jgi:hypothetical protein